MTDKISNRFNRDKFELIKLAMDNSGLKAIKNIDTDTSQKGEAVKRYYSHSLASLLAKAPWNFATKRARLKRIEGEEPVDSYRYLYEIPKDALYLWDIYNRGAKNIETVFFWDISVRYSYYTFPLDDGLTFSDRLGEVIGGKIASNFGELSVLYTLDREFPLQRTSQQFFDILLLDLEEALVKYRATDEEKLQTRLNTNETHKRRALARAGNENRYSRDIPESKTVQYLKSSASWR